MIKLEQAHASELDLCSEIINEGRAFQREQGFVQWTDDYPNIDIIRNDIQSKKGYVIRVEGRIAGYMCIDFDGDPDYEHIEGQWHTDTPYAVVHRMAFRREFRNMGLTEITFRLIEEFCLSNGIQNIRMDTGFSNSRMQHVLEKNGFSQCGTIIFEGNGRVAYDKTLI